ncbi:ABC transporter ATP-binding protein [Sulfurospirillum diekertiae]|uniref:ABC transporter ATP-binding protein n=1 Tax=Sulfurospirillum diekertiae TaxID=1854492 RepID=UPI001427907D|nr:ABC transporter ATP-binding protein [Sulfurospirillum diekertiae]QIR78106.1 ABC transporter ATP-binding protein [Sulfurospirillum diekertiae]
MIQEPILEVVGVGKAYRAYNSEFDRVLSWFGIDLKPEHETWTLQDFNFSIASGEAIGIIGQNGAGKSTLLKIITGTLKPSKGSVAVRGKIAAILELGMGFHPDLTGRQNAYHSAGLMGYSLEQIDGVIEEIESFADIGEYFEQPVRTYSSGMQARVAFAVATAFRPDILIVDEALSVGDAYFQAKCYERIIEFKKKGTSLLLVTHSINDIVRHCDRAVFLKKGLLIMDGSPKDVSNLYFDELFGKSKKMVQNLHEQQIKNHLTNTNSCDDIFHTRFGYRKEEYRWGNGGAKIIDYSIVSNEKEFPQQLESNALTDFYVKVHFDSSFHDLTIGFLIKTLDGVFLYGTNSYIASYGKEIMEVERGDIKIFKFSLSMSLNSGHYLVSFGVATGPQENLEPLDRRYDSIMICVDRSVSFWGIMDLNAKFEVIENAE